MYVFFASLFLFIAISVGSLLVTYLFTVLQKQSGRHPEPTINNVVMVQLQLLTTTVTDSVGDMVSQTSQTAFGFASNIFQNSKKILQLLVIALILLEVSNNTGIVLQTGDTSWRCVVQPLFQNVLLSVGQILRVIYDGFIPIYNYNYVVTSQAVKGSVAIAIKCDLSTVVGSIELLIESWIAIFKSLFMWAGVSGVEEMSAENNIFYNELNVTDVFNKTQLLISKQQDIASCICDGLTDVIDIAFVVVRQKELPLAINHAVNVPVSVVQTIFQLLPLFGPVFPSLKMPLYHLNGAIFYIAKYFDRVIEDAMKKTIQLFIDNFEFEGVPEEFVFTTLARAVMSGTHAAHTAYRTAAHIALPIPFYITDADYMMKAMRFDQTARQFDIFMLNLANNGFWFLEIADQFTKAIAKSIVTGNELKIVGLPKHVRLDCEPSDKWTVFVACTPYLLTTAYANVWYIGTNFAGELLWKSIFTPQQSVLRLIQRYDGPSYPRIESISCNYRRTSATWDMTTDASHCKCDIPSSYQMAEYNEEFPFGVPNYDPFCNQPNLNANVFGNIERIVNLFDQSLKIGAAAASSTKTMVFLYLELYRVGIKTLLNLPDIFEGKFFHHKINCGYGTSERVLEKWWFQQGHSIESCSTPRLGYMAYRGECVPIHDTIRYSMCSVTANFADEKSLCTTENKEGCQCNLGLPMSDTSLCSCIYAFPDTPQEVTQTAFENFVVDKVYDKSEHWCNTYHLEWAFHYVDRIAFVLDQFFSGFHPAYNSQANAYCEQMSYNMLNTEILHLSQSQFNEQKALYDALSVAYSTKACSIYGSHDFLCSTSMTVRSAVRFVVYEVRELIMGLFELLGGTTKGITINFGNRLCDLQRLAAGFASSISSMLPVGLVSNGVREGVAKIIFAVIDAPIELLNGVNHAVQFLLTIIQETAFGGRSIQQPVFNFIIAEVNILFNYLTNLFDGFETLFEAVARGSGAIFRTFKIIIDIFKQFLSDAAIEMISLILKVFGGVVELFTGGGLAPDFFSDLWRLIGKFIEMIMKNAGKVLDAVLNLLGPVGQFIRELSGTICASLQDVLCVLSAGGFCDMGCPGIGPASFSAPPIVGEAVEAVGGFFDSVFGRRLHSSLHSLPKILHEEMEWNGVSMCDQYVHGYKDYNFTDLRPMERVQLLQCVEQRVLAVEMGRQLQMPIPVDIVYNWKRKYVMMYHLFQSGIIYSQYLMDELTTKEMVTKLKEAHIDINLYLPLWNSMRTGVRHFTLVTHLDSLVHTLFHQMDKNIKTSDTSWGNIYRIYTHAGSAIRKVYNHTTTVDLKFEVAQAGKILTTSNISLPSIPRHIRNPFSTMSKVTLKASKTSSPHKLKSRQFILRAAGLNTDITPCEEQTDSNICVNCLVIDNLLNVVINEGDRMAKYYQFTYAPVILPSFVDYFKNPERDARAKAWREDMAAMMEAAAEKTAQAAKEWTDEQVNAMKQGIEEDTKARERGYRLEQEQRARQYNNLGGRHKLHSNSTSTLTVWQRATKDWESLILKFEWRNNVTLIEAISKFLSTTDDSYVPFFAHGASFYITYPFAGDCPMSIIYGTEPGHDTTNKRLDLMETSFRYMLETLIGLYLFQWFTDFPILSLIGPYIIFILAFIFMLTTYNWTWPCFPNIPNMLVDDIFVLLNDRIFPNCWCQYWPGLAETCNLDNCFLCSIQTTYRTCPDNIPELKELGVFWAPLTWLKVNFPEVLVFLYDNPPFLWLFRRLENLDSMFQNAIYKTPLTDIENDCLRLHIGDLVVFILILYVGSKALQFGVPVVIRAAQHGLKLFTMFVGLFYTMAVSIELSTVSGAGKNTYQDDGF